MTIRLPLTVDVDDLTQAIQAAQAGCRSRLCSDPQMLARRVIVQLHRLDEMADAADTVLVNLSPYGTWWEEDGRRLQKREHLTLVELNGLDPKGPLRVVRGLPSASSENGRVRLWLKDRSQ